MRAVVLLLLLLLPTAAAHVPQVGPTQRHIDDPGRSFAFYDELVPGDTHAWTFDLAQGDPLFLHLAVPLDAAWSPRATLVGPAGEIALVRVDRVGYEPATPYASRELWTLDTQAPAAGRYTLTIAGEGGRYALGYGLAESFTPLEWILIPIDAVRVHAWQGQPWALQLLPFGLALAASARRIARDPARGAAGALSFGTAASLTLQMGLAIAAGAEGPAWAWIFTSVAILLSLAVGIGIWRAKRRASLVALAVAGLACWSGLLLGPALALAAAVTSGTSSPRRREAGSSR